MAKSGNVVPTITKAEHIGPDDTGDNIEAKRVANYNWDGTNWQRSPQAFINASYDYVSNSSTSTSDTFTFKTGGSSGTVVATVAVVYTDSSKATISSVTRT